MHTGTIPEDFEETLRRLWRGLSTNPSCDELDLLDTWLRHGAMTPYKASRILESSVAAVYRKAEKLLQKRLLVPWENEGLTISIKGCIELFIAGRLGLHELARCASRIWGVYTPIQQLAGFLYLLGREAARRRLNLQTLTMCNIDEAAIHVARHLKDVINLYSTGCCSFSNALDRVASEAGLNPLLFREALRLALRGLATSLPLTVADDEHVITVLIHGGEVYWFVLSCKNPCGEYTASLGFHCPLARAAVEARLKAIVSALERKA